MATKRTEEYFENLKKEKFHKFIIDFAHAFEEFAIDCRKCKFIADEGECVSKNFLSKMRGKTVDLEKFGKQFRLRTIAMEKE